MPPLRWGLSQIKKVHGVIGNFPFTPWTDLICECYGLCRGINAGDNRTVPLSQYAEDLTHRTVPCATCYGVAKYHPRRVNDLRFSGIAILGRIVGNSRTVALERIVSNHRRLYVCVHIVRCVDDSSILCCCLFLVGTIYRPTAKIGEEI